MYRRIALMTLLATTALLGSAQAFDGVYEVTLPMAEHSFQMYVFINGDTWEGQETVPAEYGVDNGYGGYNRGLDVHDAADGDMAVGFWFGACEAAVASQASSFSAVKALFE